MDVPSSAVHAADHCGSWHEMIRLYDDKVLAIGHMTSPAPIKLSEYVDRVADFDVSIGPVEVKTYRAS